MAQSELSGFLAMPVLLLFLIPALVLSAAVAASAFLLLEPCAVDWRALDRFGSCPPASEAAQEARLAELDTARGQIERQILELERELVGTQCLANGPDQRRPFVQQGWDNRMNVMLFGCWDVSLDYQTRDVDSDAVMSYADWQICFDAGAQGREIMRDTNGVVCEGPITAQFTQAGNLSLSEAENLPCSDGGYIHRREIACQMADDGTARCATLQPETGGEAEVALARRMLP